MCIPCFITLPKSSQSSNIAEVLPVLLQCWAVPNLSTLLSHILSCYLVEPSPILKQCWCVPCLFTRRKITIFLRGKLHYENLSAVFYDINVMNAEVFAEGLEKCRLLTNLLGRKVENLDDYGCQKFKILSKGTVRGSDLVTLSDTKQGFTVPKRKQRCTENRLRNICKFLYVSSKTVSWDGRGGGGPSCIKIGYSEPTRAESREGTSNGAESSRVT